MIAATVLIDLLEEKFYQRRIEDTSLKMACYWQVKVVWKSGKSDGPTKAERQTIPGE